MVLLVDNGDGLEQKYRRALESRGYRVVLAGDGETAVRLTGQMRFDVVVGDLDGHEDGACQTMRSIHRQHEELPLVLLADGLGFSRAKAAVECGAYRYLLAPVSEDALLKVLVEAIHDREERLT